MYYKTRVRKKKFLTLSLAFGVVMLDIAEKIVKAVQKQVEKMDYGLSFQMGHKLSLSFPKNSLLFYLKISIVFFYQFGSEAVDSALK